jgi:hypothetical protein
VGKAGFFSVAVNAFLYKIGIDAAAILFNHSGHDSQELLNMSDDGWPTEAIHAVI